jgi:hypothetical protein
MAPIPTPAARFAGLACLLIAGAPGLIPGLASAETGAIEITRADCSRLVKHTPAPDVAYQPGVDVHGNPVAPADLDGGYQVALPRVIRIPITVLLQDRFGIPENSVLYKAEAEIGVAEIDLTDGRVTFNGQDLATAEARALSAACQEYLRAPPGQ